jgi:hypothetical protein
MTSVDQQNGYIGHGTTFRHNRDKDRQRNTWMRGLLSYPERTMLQSTARVGSAEYRHGLAHQGLLGAVIRLEKEHLTLSYSLRFINLTSTDSFLFVIAKVHQDMPTTFLLQNGKYGTFSRSPFVLHPATIWTSPHCASAWKISSSFDGR